VCTFYQEDSLNPSGGGNMMIRGEQTSACIPYFNSVESDLILTVDLPASFVSANLRSLSYGTLFANVTGATIVEGVLQVNSTTAFNVLDQLPDNMTRRLQTKTTGSQTLMVVRVTTQDGVSPPYTLDEMRARIFGDGIGLRSQYLACSSGQLAFEDAGGLDITLPLPIANYTNSYQLVSAAQQAIYATTGMLANQIADKVMFCEPPGTGSWLASAVVNSWRNNFNNNWCLSLSANMHEMGHNIGNLHSGLGTDEYGDITGYMGYGSSYQDAPQKCFNGVKNHQHGWFQTREVAVDPNSTNLIQLAAFTDFNKTSESQPVLLSIGAQYYLQYNRAKLFNVGTGAKIDTVTITEDTIGWSTSRAGLAANEEWTVQNFTGTGRTLIVKACERIDATTSDGVDIMIVSIGLDMIFCPSPTPTESPTKAPFTTAPSQSPVIEFPSLPPSQFSTILSPRIDHLCARKNEACKKSKDCCGKLQCLTSAGHKKKKKTCQKCHNVKHCTRNKDCCHGFTCTAAGRCNQRK